MMGPKKMLSTKRQHDGVSTVGKANIVSATCTISKKNKTNNTLNDDGNNGNDNIETIEFASQIIVQFLSTPSLVLFSSCNKACMVAVKTEVSNRKKKIAQMNSRVKVLLGLTNNNGDGVEFDTLTRANVVEAARLCKEAKRIIDADLNWHSRIISEDRMSEEFDASKDKYFGKERELLESYRDLRMLPNSFYFPPDGSEPLQQLNEEHVKLAQFEVSSIWDAGEMMKNIMELYSDHPLYYSDPFFKFQAPCVHQFFSDIVSDAAQVFTTSSSPLEALRFAAREFVYSHRHSRDCIHYLIHCADEMRTEILKRQQ